MRVQHEYTTNEKDGMEKEMVSLHVTIDKEANICKHVDVNDNNSQEVDR